MSALSLITITGRLLLRIKLCDSPIRLGWVSRPHLIECLKEGLHLGHGYIRNQVVACWQQVSRHYDEAGQVTEEQVIWQVCRPDGRCGRMLSEAEAKASLVARRDKDSKVIYYCNAEYTRIADAHWYEMTR